MLFRFCVFLSVLTVLAAAVFPAVAAEPQPYTKKEKVFTLVLENDLFGNGTDQNYTNGLRLTYLNTAAEFPELADKVAELVPTFDINETSSVFYSIGQNLYTPDAIENPAQDLSDRPWAAYLYGAIGMLTQTGNHLDEVEAAVGVVGPAALGEQTQKFVHKYVSDSPVPRGWDNQLRNEPTFLLGWNRMWPDWQTQKVVGLNFAVSPYIGATVGNVYTFANTGISFRLGPQSGGWQDTPARIRPALPGTGYFEIPEKTFSWFLFAGIEGRALARNIFLDGNTFRNSHSVDKRYFVGDANVGLAVTWGRARVSYTLNHRSKEFKGQDSPDLFGALSVGIKF